jgi:hypothetical protein
MAEIVAAALTAPDLLVMFVNDHLFRRRFTI